MLITIVYPFADARRFMPNVGLPLPLPGWPRPETGEFVRSCGTIRSRKPFEDWIPEPLFCDARRLMRFPEFPKLSFRRGKRSYKGITFMPVARRLFFDGMAMGKVELAMRPRSFKGDASLSRLDPDELIRTIQEAKIAIRSRGVERQITMGEFRRHLPKLWCENTTPTSVQAGEAGDSWIASGSPIILISVRMVQALHGLSSVGRWALTDPKPRTGGEPGKAIIAYRGLAAGDFSGCWMIAEGRHGRNFGRGLRITLCRLHAESVALRLIMRFIASTKFLIRPRSKHSQFLQDYLHDAVGKINRLTDRYPSTRVGGIVDVAQRVFAESSPNERNLVLDRLRNVLSIRGNYFRNFERLLRSASRPVPSEAWSEKTAVLTNYHGPVSIIKVQGHVLMSQGNKTIRLGDGATVSAPVVVADTIENSFNALTQSQADPQLKRLVEQLLKKVAEVSKSVAEEQAATLATDAATLAREAASMKPRRRTLEVTLDGLQEAATVVGEVGKPILETVGKLLPLVVALFP